MDNRYELDFYIPSKNLAIECNGVYWHDSNHKPKEYHFNKWKECRDKGVKLISIWEDWYINNQDIVSDIILRNLNIYQGVINYEINNISNKECDEFLQLNHIYGYTKYGKCCGMFVNKQLIGVVCVIKRKGKWQLIRYCELPGINIIDGLERSLKYLNIDEIDICISNDLGYELKYNKEIYKQKCWCIDKNYHRHHKTSFTKEEIDKYFLIIFDSGYTKYHLTVC